MLRIKARDLAADIRARLSDFELMSQYGLSLNQLEYVIGQLVESGTIRKDEIEERGPFFDDPANRLKTRRFPRTYLRVPLEIEDVNNSANKCLLVDLSEEGFRVRGITSGVVGKEKTFLVYPNGVRGRTVRLSATCVWAKLDLDAGFSGEAGFKIISISDNDMLALKKAAKLLGLGDRNLSAAR